MGGDLIPPIFKEYKSGRSIMNWKLHEKSFFDLTPAQKEVVLADLAKGIPFSKIKPLSPRGKALWEAAKRGRGRAPKK
jgi:hypothetical protein